MALLRVCPVSRRRASLVEVVVQPATDHKRVGVGAVADRAETCVDRSALLLKIIIQRFETDGGVPPNRDLRARTNHQPDHVIRPAVSKGDTGGPVDEDMVCQKSKAATDSAEIQVAEEIVVGLNADKISAPGLPVVPNLDAAHCIAAVRLDPNLHAKT